MKIVAVEPIGISANLAQQLVEKFKGMGHDFVCYADRKEDEVTLIERMQDADIVIVSNIKISSAVLERCSRLKMLSVAFTGIDHIDLNYCRQRHIAICNASGYATKAVGELAIGLMLDVYRNITSFDASIRKGGSRGMHLGKQLYGKTAGIVGTGAIGCQTAELLLAFGCKVVAWSRTKKQQLIDKGVEYLDLEDLMSVADIVSLHVPLTDETYHLIDAKKLSLCKSSAILINTARGNVIDNTALAIALKEGKLAGAGIDVFETEPPLPPHHPLFEAPHCVMIPHVGYATEEAFAHRINIVLDNIYAYLSGKVINNCL